MYFINKYYSIFLFTLSLCCLYGLFHYRVPVSPLIPHNINFLQYGHAERAVFAERIPSVSFTVTEIKVLIITVDDIFLRHISDINYLRTSSAYRTNEHSYPELFTVRCRDLHPTCFARVSRHFPNNFGSMQLLISKNAGDGRVPSQILSSR
jgi:hypothetical protein